MIGVGYYWAINRSYDAMYRAQLFTERGFAHTVDFRGKPTAASDFDWYLYGVNDKGLKTGTTLDAEGKTVDVIQKQGGFFTSFTGRAELGDGFSARANINYLSSFRFRQAFTESFNEAIGSEVQATAFVTSTGWTPAWTSCFPRRKTG